MFLFKPDFQLRTFGNYCSRRLRLLPRPAAAMRAPVPDVPAGISSAVCRISSPLKSGSLILPSASISICGILAGGGTVELTAGLFRTCCSNDGSPSLLLRLNALSYKDLLQCIAEYRRRNLRTVKSSLRRIQHDQHRILRLISRYKAHERSNIFTGCITACFRKFFGGNPVLPAIR